MSVSPINPPTNGKVNSVDNNKVKKVPIQVESRINFTKIGEIDTKNEKFAAEAYIECIWEDQELLKLILASKAPNIKVENPDDITEKEFLNLYTMVRRFPYDSDLHWSPEIFVENAIGDPKQSSKYRLELVKTETNKSNGKISAKNLTIKVIEKRKVEGFFYERLELNDFPIDLQELSIKLTSKKSVEDVVLVENKLEKSGVNTENFADQQQWDLFDHVKMTSETVNDRWRKYIRSQFIVSSFVVRKFGFYLYNAFVLIFLITTIGFTTFSITVNTPQFRCQVTGLLLLTSVNFRWIITQRLPSVSYLTLLDKYAIGCLFYLAMFFIWHSIIGSDVITADLTEKQRVDYIFLYVSAGLYLVFNLVFVLWFTKLLLSVRSFRLKNKKFEEGPKFPKNNDIEIVDYEENRVF